MQENPLVSYIIPSYNHAPYIAQAIESVLQQTYSPIELIVVDDGSKDNTREVLESYQGREGITIVFNEKNLRQSATINKALKLAKGEFIGLLPSDDWLLPDKVQLQMDKFHQVSERVGVIYGKGARFFENEESDDELIKTNYTMHRGKITEHLLRDGNFIYPITPLFRKACFDKYAPDESYTAEGEAIYLKFSLSFEFDFVDEVVGVMRDHVSNTGKITDLMYQENLRYLTEFFARDDLPNNIYRLKNSRLAALKKVKAMELIVSKRDYERGKALALGALKLQPLLVKNYKFVMAIVLAYLPSRVTNTLLDKLYTKKQSY